MVETLHTREKRRPQLQSRKKLKKEYKRMWGYKTHCLTYLFSLSSIRPQILQSEQIRAWRRIKLHWRLAKLEASCRVLRFVESQNAGPSEDGREGNAITQSHCGSGKGVGRAPFGCPGMW